MKNNKLIAEFMGATEQDYDEFGIGMLFPKLEKYMERQAPSISELKYNSSWDWLIPVVIKIELLYYNKKSKKYDGILHKYMEETNFEKDWYIEGNYFALIFKNMDELYKIVVEFIKWYNKYK